MVQSCWVLLIVLISHDLPYLVLYALTGLQAGKDLALDCLDPQFPLLICRRFEVPRLARQRHNDELKGVLLLWKTQINNKLALQQTRMSHEKSDSASQRHSSVIEAHPCTDARWDGLLLNSATLKWFLGTCWAPWHCCFVRWCLKISNSQMPGHVLIPFCQSQMTLKTIAITNPQQHTISPFFKSQIFVI